MLHLLHKIDVRLLIFLYFKFDIFIHIDSYHKKNRKNKDTEWEQNNYYIQNKIKYVLNIS